MGRPKKVREETEEARDDAKTAVRGEVVVRWLGRERVYSKEIHGEKYRELAKEFAGQYPDSVIE